LWTAAPRRTRRLRGSGAPDHVLRDSGVGRGTLSPRAGELDQMSTIDIAALSSPISEESPCGDDLEYDPAFGEMERAAQGKPEQEMGNAVIAAEEPDWKDLKSKSLAVLSRSRDLRAATYLTRA